jgi:hypothetical protein
MKVTKAQEAAQRRIAKALTEIGFALPGSLTVRAYRCGKTNCRCHDEPPQLHGPYNFWTRKVDNKTVSRILTDEQLAEYQPLFDNARRLRTLVNELQDLSLQIIEADGRAPARKTKTKTPAEPTPKPRRNPAARRPTRFT